MWCIWLQHAEASSRAWVLGSRKRVAGDSVASSIKQVQPNSENADVRLVLDWTTCVYSPTRDLSAACSVPARRHLHRLPAASLHCAYLLCSSKLSSLPDAILLRTVLSTPNSSVLQLAEVHARPCLHFKFVTRTLTLPLGSG